MRDRAISSRRRFFRRAAAAAGTMLLTGCQRLSESEWFPKVLSVGEKLSAAAGTLVVGLEPVCFAKMPVVQLDVAR